MLKWYEELYVGENARKKVRHYIRQVNRGKQLMVVYLITIASNEANQLDIIKSNYLLQPVVMRMCPMIVGIAKGYSEAQDLVIQMVEETLNKTGNADVRNYLLQR